MPLPNGAFFGTATDNIRILPDPLFLALGFYNQTRAFTDAQYIVQTDINTFDWTNFDAMSGWCAANHLIRSWYGGYIGGDTEQWLTNFPTWTNAQIVQATTNFLVAAAARSPNFAYINFCNEGLLHGDPTNRFPMAFGGSGATGYDWIINLAKLFRTHFPNAKLGLNDFDWEAAAFGPCYGNPPRPSLLPQLLSALQALIANNAQIDWMGAEGYSPECNSIPDILSAISQVANLGLPIIWTEFTPYSVLLTLNQADQLAAWQSRLTILANHPHVIGVTGPIDFRRSDATSDQIGGYIIDDTTTSPTLTPTANWLQSYLLPPQPTPPPPSFPDYSTKPIFPVPNVYLPPPTPAARYIVTIADLNQPF